MDVSKRNWEIKDDQGNVEGPYSEEVFQEKLRAGEIPIFYQIRSNFMDNWQPIVTVISSDETFHRPSSIPPPPPKEA